MKKTYKEIPVVKIKTNNNQPRKYFDEEKIEELALSIKENGLLQPISVVKKDTHYLLIAGERRFRACSLLQMKEVPCIVIKQNDEDTDLLAIIENIQRENLSVIEEAISYTLMIEKYNFTQTELAKKLGKKQATIANKIRLLKLQPEVKQELEKKTITERHARALLSIERDKQLDFLQKIIKNQLNVKQTEEMVTKITKPKAIIKSKSVSKNGRIAINTINQSLKLLKDTGIDLNQEVTETEQEIVITIKISK